MNASDDSRSNLRVCRSSTKQTAHIVSVRQKDGEFVACCREDAGERRKATGTGPDEALAIIRAAMRLFEIEPFVDNAEDGYVFETGGDSSFDDACAFPWPRGQIPYGVMYGMKHTFVRRKPRDDAGVGEDYGLPT